MNLPQAFVNPPLLATGIIGTAVVDPHGQRIGEVRDIVADPGNGEVAFAVLSFAVAPRSSAQAPLFAIAYEELEYNLDCDEFVLDLPADRLDTAERFGPECWPLSAGRDGPHTVYRFGGHSRRNAS